MMGDEDAGERRAADQPGLEDRQVERQCAGEVLGRHEPRDQRLTRRAVERDGRGAEGIEEVEQPERFAAREGEGGEPERDESHRDLGRHHHPPAVVAIGDDAAPEGEDDDRHHARQADEAEGERRFRQQVDVPVDGDDLHLRARQRQELRNDQPPVVAMGERHVRRSGGGGGHGSGILLCGAGGAPAHSGKRPGNGVRAN